MEQESFNTPCASQDNFERDSGQIPLNIQGD